MPVDIFLTASRKAPGFGRPKANMAVAGDIQTWVDAVAFHDKGMYNESTKTFLQFQPSAKIFFNIGFQYFIREDFENAFMNFTEALNRDQYLAIGSFMLGNCHLKLKEYSSAFAAFGKTHELMRKSTVMDYKQLGMDHKLYLCDILVNKSLAAMKLGRIEKARNILLRALQCSFNGRTDRVKFALESLQSSDTYSSVGMPNNAIFRPVKQTVSSLEKKNYLGKSKVVSSISFSKEEESRPKVSRRDALNEDIRKPEYKASLKRTKKRPEKTLPSLPNDSSPSEARPPRKALPPNPLLLLSNDVSVNHTRDATSTQPPVIPARQPRPRSPNRPPPMRPPPRGSKPQSPTSINGSLSPSGRLSPNESPFPEPKIPDLLSINLNIAISCTLQIDSATNLEGFRKKLNEALVLLPSNKLILEDINGNKSSLNDNNLIKFLHNSSSKGTHNLVIEN